MWIVLSGSIMSCKNNQDDLPLSISDQKILFQYEYINCAWGFQHNGWIIDSSGTVYTYNKPYNWIFPNSSDMISSNEVENNLILTDTISFQIDREVLISKFHLLKKAAMGQTSKPINKGNDMGAYCSFGYTYNSVDGNYKQVLLKQTGDFLIDNSAKEAKELHEWMVSIDSKIRK